MPDPLPDPPCLSAVVPGNSAASTPETNKNSSAGDSREPKPDPVLTPASAVFSQQHGEASDHLNASTMADDASSSTNNAESLGKNQEAAAETMTPKTDATPGTMSTTEAAPKKVVCKKHASKSKDKSKKKKKKAAESSSSDSDSDDDDESSTSDSSSSDSDSSDSDSSDSSDSDSRKKSKKKKKAKAKARAKKSKQKKKARKEESSSSEDDSDSEDESSYDDEKAKKAKLKAKKKAKKAKKLADAETENDGDEDAAETQTTRGTQRTRGGLRYRQRKLRQAGYIDPKLIAEQNAQLIQQQQRALQKAKAKKQKRASKVAYKRIDQCRSLPCFILFTTRLTTYFCAQLLMSFLQCGITLCTTIN